MEKSICIIQNKATKEFLVSLQDDAKWSKDPTDARRFDTETAASAYIGYCLDHEKHVVVKLEDLP